MLLLHFIENRGQAVQQTLASIEGVDGGEAGMVFSPPWTPQKMSEEAKAAFGVI